ncbi:MAG: hypothetical protein Fur0042_10250 [Cyanophyceae cyanobacterium]
MERDCPTNQPTELITLSTMNTSILSKLATAALSLGAITLLAPSAMAGSLVPTQEGEVNVGLGLVDPAQAVSLNGFTITSLSSADLGRSDNITRSRLFVDETSTANYYSDDYQFDAKDVGTNGQGLWFRASDPEEKGQLETGLFRVDFAQAVASLKVDFFDVEFGYETGILSYVMGDGTVVNARDYIGYSEIQYDANGVSIDGQFHSRTYSNVKSIIMKIGEDVQTAGADGKQLTGDGVLFRLTSLGDTPAASVPEPGMVLGLSGLAFAAMFKGGKKRAI